MRENTDRKNPDYGHILRREIGLTENTWTFWKHFWCISNFLVLLTENNSALKMA